MSEADVLRLFDRCSNQQRWGSDDSHGTLNFITDECRTRAASLIRLGRIVPLAQTLSTVTSLSNTSPVELQMLDVGERADITCMDAVTIACHGVTITHLDAIGHMYFEDQMYGARSASAEISPAGLGFADVLPLSDGIFTRGVLLDITAARGVDWLEVGEGVTATDLDRAEALTGTTVGSGDVIFVHTGTERREAATGLSPPTRRTGLTPDCLPWIFDREVAVYSGDCTEQIPSGYERVPYPLHQIGFVAFGLVLLDNPSLTGLVAACQELGRSEFALTCAALPLPGATGSPVNPLALF